MFKAQKTYTPKSNWNEWTRMQKKLEDEEKVGDGAENGKHRNDKMENNGGEVKGNN